MSIGKSSISRLSHAAEAKESGIRSLAPEVPAGDAATPFTAVAEELTAEPKVPAAAPTEKKKVGRKPKAAKADAPTAPAEKKKPGRKPKAVTGATPAKKTASKTATASATPKAAAKAKTTVPKKTTEPKATDTKRAPKTKDAFTAVQVGEALPYWLL